MTGSGPTAALLGDGSRLHLQHGPIDLVIGAEGNRAAAFAAATARFQTLLTELVAELPLLRQRVGPVLQSPALQSPVLQGVVARRMHRACARHGRVMFVTPMAAVAGAVADEVLAAMVKAAAPLRAYVNNGGDIAVHLTVGQVFTVAIAGLNNRPLGRVTLRAADRARGLATSGQGGRSLSMGIADAVTVLGRNGAEADVAATLIANAVDLPGHAAVHRVPACKVQPDSDLGDRLVVVSVGDLSPAAVSRALNRGLAAAEAMRVQGMIDGAALFLRGQSRILGGGNRFCRAARPGPGLG